MGSHEGEILKEMAREHAWLIKFHTSNFPITSSWACPMPFSLWSSRRTKYCWTGHTKQAAIFCIGSKKACQSWVVWISCEHLQWECPQHQCLQLACNRRIHCYNSRAFSWCCVHAPSSPRCPGWSPANQHHWRWELLPPNSQCPDFEDRKPPCGNASQNNHWNSSQLHLVHRPHFPFQRVSWWWHHPARIFAKICRCTIQCSPVISGDAWGRGHESDSTRHWVLHVALVCHSKYAQPATAEHISQQRACRASAPNKKNPPTREAGWASSAHHVDISLWGSFRWILGPYPLCTPPALSSQF